MAENNNQNILEEGINNANKIKSAVNTGKAIANISKGAASGGLYGAIAIGVWENKGLVIKIIVVGAFLLLLPILFIMMLPSIIFNGLVHPSTTDIMNNDVAIKQNISSAQTIISDLVNNSHSSVLNQINIEIAKLGENEKGVIADNYADGGLDNVFLLISQYSAYKDDFKKINLDDLKNTISKGKDNLYSYTIITTQSTQKVLVKDSNGNIIKDKNGNAETKDVTVKTYTYTIKYNGSDYFNNLFNLTADQQSTASDYANNLMIYLYGANTITGGANSPIDQNVYDYAPLIDKYAELYGISEYKNLLYAITMTESGGHEVDVMQSSECGYNTKYPKRPNGITDSEYSVDCGVHYFADCLKIASCNSPTDLDKLSLAIQGYNYGSGYISWALKNYGGYSKGNAQAFSDMEKAKLGVTTYGNPNYVPKVMSYFMPLTASSGNADGKTDTTGN